jgi:hypothetical protein
MRHRRVRETPRERRKRELRDGHRAIKLRREHPEWLDDRFAGGRRRWRGRLARAASWLRRRNVGARTAGLAWLWPGSGSSSGATSDKLGR